jgi:hypothetical protein
VKCLIDQEALCVRERRRARDAERVLERGEAARSGAQHQRNEREQAYGEGLLRERQGYTQ